MMQHRIYATPDSRASCPPSSSPCPHVGCRHNTFLDVDADGRLHILDRVPVTDPRRGSGCSLWEEHSEEGLAARWGMTRRQIGEIEDAALGKVRARLSKAARAAFDRLIEARRREDEASQDGDGSASDDQDEALDAGSDGG